MNRIKDFLINYKLLVYLISFTVFFISGSILYLLSQNELKLSFGAEYESIARSIISGEGYSNPFFDKTGKTAWMPPVLVFLQAAVFIFFKNSLNAFIFLSFIKLLAYLFTLLAVYKLFKILNIKNYFLFYLLFIIYFLFSPYENFGRISDLWLGIFLQSSFLFYYHSYRNKLQRRDFLFLCIILFLAPLINPSIAIGLVIVIVFFFIYDLINPLKRIRDNKPEAMKYIFTLTKKHFILAAAFLFAILLWGTRNYYALGKFIPTKSNYWFEFYQSNVIDYDGCLSYSTVTKVHPISNKEARVKMAQLGELAYLEKYQEISKNYKNDNKHDYRGKVINRLINAYAFIKLDMDEYPSLNYDDFKNPDLVKLEMNKFLREGIWLSLELPDEIFKEKLINLELDNIDLVYNDWLASKAIFIKKGLQLTFLLRSLMMSGIITISIFLLLFTKYRNNSLYISSILIYISFLLPYIINSHQLRYQRPLFLLQSIILTLLLSAIISLLRKKWSFKKLT